jgi:GNAT superfamily N-acetyltransferase|tara:strand:- start:78 stop:515 length:438 start_codon:yes stop_codon:yes gene_type:complete
MYYKIDLSNYEPREVPKYQEFTKYNQIKWEQIEMIDEELDNFKDSFGKSWSEWTLNNLKNRLKDGWTFYLVEGGWCFIDWNRRYPYLCNRYVFPEHRNRGLGSDLVWLRCNEIKEQGYDTAMIKLEDWNTPALSVMKEKIFTKMD